MRIAYLVLHYMAGKDTIECIHSILNVSKKSEHQVLVIVVDNGSLNDSYFEICREFENNNKVKIIHSDTNLGFAKGNNLGFHYAKHEWNADFIVQLNNDTIVSQENFNEAIVNKYNENKYAVLGPDIITKDNFHQNPVPKKLFSIRDLHIYRMKKYIKLAVYYARIENLLLGDKEKEIYRKTPLIGDQKVNMLHGACLIFSPVFIRKYDGMCDRTFLYWEEDILGLMMKKDKMIMLYSSDLRLYHKEDASTNAINKSKREKTIWVEKQLIRSSRVYENILKELI